MHLNQICQSKHAFYLKTGGNSWIQPWDEDGARSQIHSSQPIKK